MKDIYWLPSIVLFIIGLYDILRGIMHTFFLRWAAVNFAGFDLATAPADQIFLLGVFGISNFVTGFVFLLISLKARQIAPYVLIIIPLAYLLGLIGIRVAGVHGQSAFTGQYFMFVYFAVCIITFIYFLVHKKVTKQP